MKKELIKDTYVLLSGPILTGLTYVSVVTKLFDSQSLYLLLMMASLFISVVSLFIIPRYIRKGIDTKDKKKILLSIIISILAGAPFIVALGAWVNYAV